MNFDILQFLFRTEYFPNLCDLLCLLFSRDTQFHNSVFYPPLHPVPIAEMINPFQIFFKKKLIIWTAFITTGLIIKLRYCLK